MKDTQWMADASCAPGSGFDPEIWFPSDVGAGQRADVRRAQSICGACPVKEQCREHGKEQAAGVWGGVHRIRGRAVSTRVLPVHGTVPGYKWHLRHDEKACDPCLRANRRAWREYKQQQRQA